MDFSINTKLLEKAIRIGPQYLKEELGDAFDHVGRKFLKAWRKERLQGPPGVKARPRGIFTHFKRVMLTPLGGLNDMGTVIYTDSKIAKLHELGGTVEAGGRSMAVPLSARTQMFTTSGALRKRYKKPQNIKNLRVVPFKGKRFLVKFKRGSGELEPKNILYVLKNKIQIRPRLGFFSTWHESMELFAIARLNKAVKKALDRI
jgi:hypothetical protein